MTQTKKTLVGTIDDAVLAYTVGRDPVLDRDLVEWDCIGTAAHVTMLAEMPGTPPVLTRGQRDEVVGVLKEIIREARAGNFEITLADQDVHLAVERRLTDRLGDLGRRVHTGRSRNDQVATDLRLYSREQLSDLADELLALAGALLGFASAHEHVPMVGRTHLQPAMPSSVGLWASGYAEMFVDDLESVHAALAYGDRCPLGSAAGYGVPLPIDREATSRRLGFKEPQHNVFCASMERGKAESMALFAASQIMTGISRLAEDLILFTMPEFGYFVLPPEFCTGSSIMPQKNNPDVLELARAKAGQAIGRTVAALSILKGLPGGYNRDLQEIKPALMEGLGETRQTLRVMKSLCEGITVNEPALRAGFSPGVFATDRALELVARGTPFREAYRHVRANLGELEQRSPDAAIAAKQHLGGTAGLDLEKLEQRIETLRTDNAARREARHARLSELLGTNYPEIL